MGVLQRNDVLSEQHMSDLNAFKWENTNFLKRTSATKYLPPLTDSAKKTLPVVAIATICECSLNGLNEIGSWISPFGLRE